jgi:hypothetical protein
MISRILIYYFFNSHNYPAISDLHPSVFVSFVDILFLSPKIVFRVLASLPLCCGQNDLKIIVGRVKSTIDALSVWNRLRREK